MKINELQFVPISGGFLGKQLQAVSEGRRNKEGVEMKLAIFNTDSVLLVFYANFRDS